MNSRGKEEETLDTSSDQDNEQVKEDNNTSNATPTTPKRIYECSFCKRGFTNAQALGGHMNIHRKDRAKASGPTVPSIPSKPNVEFNNPRGLMGLISNEYTSRFDYSVSDVQRSNYQMFFPPSGSNPRQHSEYYPFHYGEMAPRPRSSKNVANDHHGEILAANLSLRIQSEENRETRKVKKEEEVDLELRLGQHDPNQ